MKSKDLSKPTIVILKRFSCVVIIFSYILSGCGKSDPADITQTVSSEKMVFIKGGEFLMGSNEGMLHEKPVHKVSVKSFWIDAKEVTVKEFARFVKETGYQTEAEKFGWSGVFDLNTKKWTRGDGADWQNPEGEGVEPDPNEPVTQVSWNDAKAFAKWAGKRLPTEAEWEFAARGGLVGKTYAWGNELRPDGNPVANWWQGSFPDRNTVEDGFLKRAPVGSFQPNGFGLYDMAGNVWEWTADWYAANYYAGSPEIDPKGVENGIEKVIRGGSWMCAENFCSNYRVAGKSHSTPDTGLNNIGFRCVKDK